MAAPDRPVSQEDADAMDDTFGGLRLLPVLALAALTACGGGGSSGGASFAPIAAPVATAAAPDPVAAAPEPAPEPAPAPKPVCTVDLYGDSIMAGAVEHPAEVLKAMRPMYSVYDHSVPGETAVTRAKTFNNEQRSGRFVVIEYGVNDAAQGTDYAPALVSMVSYVKSEGRTPILTGLTQQVEPEDKFATYNATMQSVAKSEGTAFADWRSVAFDPKQDNVDNVHPDGPYTERLVSRLADVLDTLAPECKGEAS